MRIGVLILWLGLACITAAAQEHKISVQKYVIPKYPPIARAARIEGEVRLKLDVAATGEITKIEVISGHPMLKQAAVVDAIKGWRFHCDDCRFGEAFKHIFTFRFRIRDDVECFTNVRLPNGQGTLLEPAFRLPGSVTINETPMCVETTTSY